MSFNSHSETAPAFHFLGTAISKFKIMEMQQTATISSQSFSQNVILLLHTSYTMHNAYSKLLCTLTLSRCFSRSKVRNLLIEFYNCKFPYNTS